MTPEERYAAIDVRLDRIVRMQEEMAARQSYHDDAFERMDSELKALKDAVAADAENIRALARIAEIHHRRISHLEGDSTDE